MRKPKDRLARWFKAAALTTASLSMIPAPARAQTWTVDGIVINISYKLARDFVTPASRDLFYSDIQSTITLHGQKSISEVFDETDYLKSGAARRTRRAQHEVETGEEQQGLGNPFAAGGKGRGRGKASRQSFSLKWTIVSPTKLERTIERNDRILHMIISLDKAGHCKFAFNAEWKPGFTNAIFSWQTDTGGTIQGIAGLPHLISSTCDLKA